MIRQQSGCSKECKLRHPLSLCYDVSMKFQVKSLRLAPAGRKKIEMAEHEMPVLGTIRADFKKRKPFRGLTIAACLHITKETAVLLETLKVGGAKVVACGSNPLSTQDDVAAALAKAGIAVFAWKHQTDKTTINASTPCSTPSRTLPWTTVLI